MRRDTCPNPACAKSLKGAPIPERDLKSYGDNTHFGLQIGLSTWDSTYAWKCPFCGHVWPRWKKICPKAENLCTDATPNDQRCEPCQVQYPKGCS